MDEMLLFQASVALRKAALNEEAKNYILSNPVLFGALKKAANRYIGGETLDETIEKVKLQNADGYKCSIEFMGESTRTEKESNEATEEFLRISRSIKNQKFNASFSLDLSHIGLAISEDLCFQNLKMICDEAMRENQEVTISAEDVTRTDAVLRTYQKISETHSNVSITLQAYLHRTKDDFADMLKLKGRIRIVKGAFETPAGHSLPRGEELDRTYLNYVERLLIAKHPCAIATHHNKIQQAVKEMLSTHRVDKALYEFESLYGIQSEQLQLLKDEGHPAKVYFVYGKEWYLYLCNRLAEYPMNLFRALDDIVG